LTVGFIGFVWVLYDFFQKPAAYIENSTARNTLLYLICFAGPVLAVWAEHSVVYDDWRHLYFVYPPFVILGLYAINKIYRSKFKMVAIGASVLQVISLAYFFVTLHPHEQVYFNTLVSHDDEYLRRNYELEYWGCSFKQALDDILEKDRYLIVYMYLQTLTSHYRIISVC
jgi:hypothetical protein